VITKLILQWLHKKDPVRGRAWTTNAGDSTETAAVTVTELVAACTLSLIGGGVEPLGAEEEEQKGCRARGEETAIPLISPHIEAARSLPLRP